MKALLNLIYNTLGWKTSRKFIVINSDDWGSVRIESAQDRASLQQKGFSMDGNRFNKFDMLESNEDLEQLFSTLRKFKDHRGNHPVITALTNVANPAFDKIRKNGFKEYFFEPFSETLKRYPAHDKVLELYHEGIRSNIFIPEFHGREHVQVKRWMNALQSGDEKTRIAFDHKFYTPDREDFAEDSGGFSAAFDIDSESEVSVQKKIIASGLELFETLFGYRATLFTAPSLIFHSGLESELSQQGIKLIDVPRIRKLPLGNGKHKTRINFLGKKSTVPNQVYITRNAVFEPNLSTAAEAISLCLHDIAKAFKSRKPAIISSHRAAFAGGLDPQNRENGLRALEELLAEVLTKWPDVEFVSAATLGGIITNTR
ncbi:MAG TPA: polysaccharide (de)acetylase [Flavobacterium sp.]|jgi:hypothetical protein